MSGDGAQDMQAAFHAFMLGNQASGDQGVAAKQKLMTGQPPMRQSSPLSAATTTTTPRGQEQAWKKTQRKYWQILKAFQSVLLHQWIEIDDNLGGVMDSIGNLRMRIEMETSRLERLKDEAVTQPLWKGHGYRSHHGLNHQDVNVALTYDLMKHERMMAGARKLLAAMSEGQEMLGRRLEEMVLFHTTTLATTPNETMMNDGKMWIQTVDRLEGVFRMLAAELYRKQTMVQDVLDSANDGLFLSSECGQHQQQRHSSQDAASEDKTARQVADACASAWSRTSQQSVVDKKAVQNLLNVGDFRGEGG